MSTKMSTDLNITRPTSRVIRAPGGGSSFSIAEGSTEVPAANRHRVTAGGAATYSFANDQPSAPERSTPAKKPAPSGATNAFTSWGDAPVAPASPTRQQQTANKPPAPPAPTAKKAPLSGKVGVLVCTEHAPESVVAAVAKALAVEGVSGAVTASTPDASTIAFAAKKLAAVSDVVIVAAILADPQGNLVPSLQNALSQISLTVDVPIIPGLVAQPSLLESKAVLSSLAPQWAKAAASVLSLKGGKLALEALPEPVIEKVPELTPQLEDVNSLLAVLRESLKSRGARGIAGISRKFRIADDDNSGRIEFKEFVKVIGEHSLGWTAKQIRNVFDYFDSDRSGSIDFDEFLVGIRGELNDRRRQLVLMAFEILDEDHSGVVEVNDISAKYSADKHPDVISGKRTKDEILREFLDTFDSIEKDGRVTPDEFIKYYANVSSSIDDDDYFELMIRNAWHISGGEGWCANSSCRRVLVGHTDGRQTVEEIKNDLGIGADDKQKMIERLVEQGVHDIEYIEGSDGVKYRPNGSNSQAAPGTPSRRSVDFADAGSRPSTAQAANHPNNRRRNQGQGASTLQLF